MSVQLPRHVQTRVDTYLAEMRHEINNNILVPASNKGNAWAYVANKAHELALNGWAFSN